MVPDLSSGRGLSSQGVLTCNAWAIEGPFAQMASLVLALPRLSIAPGTVALYSGVGEEGISASVHLCVRGALAKANFGSVLAALGYMAPSSQRRQRSWPLSLLPGVHFPIPSPWRCLLALQDGLQCLPPPWLSPTLLPPQVDWRTPCVLLTLSVQYCTQHVCFVFLLCEAVFRGDPSLFIPFLYLQNKAKCQVHIKFIETSLVQHWGSVFLSVCASIQSHYSIYITRTTRRYWSKSHDAGLFVVALKLFAYPFYHL